MAFLFGKLTFLVLRPSNLLAVLALAGVVRLGVPTTFRQVAASSPPSLLMAVCTVLPVGLWLTVPLEDRFPPPEVDPADVDGIVVLGGGIDGRIYRARGQPSFGDEHGAFRGHPRAGPALSGRPHPVHRRYRVERGRQRCRPRPRWSPNSSPRQGMPDGRVSWRIVPARPGTTRSLPCRWRRPRPGERWLLVTSAMHMPRSIGVFRRAGWPELQPWPVDYRTTGRLELGGEPSMGARLSELDQAAYEWWGLALLSSAGLHRRYLPGAGCDVWRGGLQFLSKLRWQRRSF